MLRNLASSLILTERDAEFDDNAPKVKGRVVTTLQKAKEVRPLVEKCVTIARKSLRHKEAAEEYATSAERGSNEWKTWRTSEEWQKWNHAIAPALAARRRAIQLLGDKQAVSILFEEIAPRFADRDGGYTRVVRLAGRRLGDAGEQAIIEFVGVRDREFERSERPAFDSDESDEAPETDEPEDTTDSPAGDAGAESDETRDSAPGANDSDESVSDAAEGDADKQD